MKKVITKCCFLLAFVATMCFSSAYAEPVDSIFDSIMAAEEERFDADAYYEELVKQIGGEDYKKFQALQERFGVSEEHREAAEKAKKQRLWLIGILSLIIALIPSFTILKQVITGEVKPAGAAAVLKSIGVLLGWGVLLFAFNFGWLWVLIFGGTKFMGAVLGVLLFAGVIYAAVSVNKYYKKLNDNNPSK